MPLDSLRANHSMLVQKLRKRVAVEAIAMRWCQRKATSPCSWGVVHGRMKTMEYEEGIVTIEMLRCDPELRTQSQGNLG